MYRSAQIFKLFCKYLIGLISCHNFADKVVKPEKMRHIWKSIQINKQTNKQTTQLTKTKLPPPQKKNMFINREHSV